MSSLTGYFLVLILLMVAVLSRKLIAQLDQLIDNQEKAFAQQQEVLEELKKLNKYQNVK